MRPSSARCTRCGPCCHGPPRIRWPSVPGASKSVACSRTSRGGHPAHASRLAMVRQGSDGSKDCGGHVLHCACGALPGGRDRCDGSKPVYIDTPGDKFLLGIVKKCHYQETQVPLRPGDVLCYTPMGWWRRCMTREHCMDVSALWPR